eukprot:UN31595
MSVTDFCVSFAYALSMDPINNKGLCKFQGFMIQFGLSVCGWTGILALNFLLHIYWLMQDEYLEKYYKYYHLAVWPLPLITAIIALSADMYDDSNFWCWIHEDHTPYRFGFFYLWVWSIFIFNSVCIIIVVKYLRSLDENVDEENRKQIRRVSVQSLGFLVAFLISWIPPTLI